MATFCLLFVALLLNCINTIRSGCVPGNCDPNDPNYDRLCLSIEQMCELVPDRGRASMDIVRIYFNPVLQQCLPFSWSGEGGNANRFVSIKNCYEICHPSDPGVRKIISSGIRPYLAKRMPPKRCDEVKTDEGVLDLMRTPKPPPPPPPPPPKVIIEKHIRHVPVYTYPVPLTPCQQQSILPPLPPLPQQLPPQLPPALPPQLPPQQPPQQQQLLSF